ALNASFFVIFFPTSFETSTLSLANASHNILTNGPFPERNTLYNSFLVSLCLLATSNPTRVLPAPGTPVTKQIDFFEFFFEREITSEIVLVVAVKLTAAASLREISETLCPL